MRKWIPNARLDWKRKCNQTITPHNHTCLKTIESRTELNAKRKGKKQICRWQRLYAQLKNGQRTRILPVETHGRVLVYSRSELFSSDGTLVRIYCPHFTLSGAASGRQSSGQKLVKEASPQPRLRLPNPDPTLPKLNRGVTACFIVRRYCSQ